MINRNESTRVLSAKYFLVFPVLAAVFLILQSSGLQAQTEPTVRSPIRSFSTTRIHSPMFIVEGKEVDDISNISPNEIQSITIIREPSKIVKYGAKAVNGVIIISLKNSNTDNELRISGVVTNGKDGKPLTGAAVMLKGTTIGSFTDMNGKYVLIVPSGTNLQFSILQFSFPDMITQEITIDNRQEINVVMFENPQISLASQ